MEDENLGLKIVEDVKTFLNQLLTVSHGIHAVNQMSFNDYGSGHPGFEALKSAFNELDLTQALNSLDLDKKIERKKRELNRLEKKHTDLTAIIGENTGESEGSLAHTLLKNIQSEIEEQIERKNNLIKENDDFEAELESKIELREEEEKNWKDKFDSQQTESDNNFISKLHDLDEKYEAEKNRYDTSLKIARTEANLEIQKAENEANRKVKLIKQFSDFLAETNKNMWLYTVVTVVLVVGVMATIYVSIPDLLKCLINYDTYITNLGPKGTPWQILNLAFGILIIKLPWALCLSAVFTGLYSLLKGLLSTYEKINQDKRNMSAIYAVSGNIAENLNEYGFAVTNHDNFNPETEEIEPIIHVSKKELLQKRESLKWNQIMNYFERMQSQTIEVKDEEDPSKIKLVSSILDKVIKMKSESK